MCSLALALVAANVQAQSAGPNSPGTVISDPSLMGSVWSFPMNATASDDARALSPIQGPPMPTNTQYLKATNFGFALPPTAVILGIQAGIEKLNLASNVVDNAIRIVKGGVVGSTDRSNGMSWPIVDTVVVHGHPADLWGETWTASDINSAGFGLAVSARDGGLDTAAVDHVTLTVFYSLCGDGMITGGEQCDDSNTNNGDCCSSTCQIEPNTVVCRPAAGICDLAENCTGIDEFCPQDSFKAPGVECRAVTPGNDCDEAEECDGNGPNCPADALKPAGTECRASANDCDVAEVCSGVGLTCPPNGFAPAGTGCADDGNTCTLDQCDGSGTCTHPADPDARCDLIPGRVIVVKPGKLAKFVSKGTFVLPGPTDNPLTEGGTLRYLDTDPGGAGSVLYNLPAGAKWKALGNPAGSKGFKYKGTGGPGDPCKVVLVKPKVIKAVCKGTDVTLAPPFDGNAAVILKIGTATVRYCAEFGGTTKRNTATIFKRKDAPPPPECAEVAPTSTPTITRTFTPTRTSTNTPTITNTPTVTKTPTHTLTPIFSFTPSHTRTPTNTRTFTNTPTLTATPSPSATATATTAFHKCTFDGDTDGSELEIILAGGTFQTLAISGAIDVSCEPGTQDVNGKRDCACLLQTFDPVQIIGIGFVCVEPSGPCPLGEMDCDGGNALGVDLIADHQAAGICTSNANCATLCTTHCTGLGKVLFSSACEGFCQGGAQANQPCDCDSQPAATCTTTAMDSDTCEDTVVGGPNAGSCEGKDDERDTGDLDCHCQCVDEAFAAHGASAAGDMRCRLGTAIRVETNLPCDNSGTLVRLPPLCGPFTTQRATARIHNANENAGTFVPPAGPSDQSGNNIACTTFDTSTVTDLDLVGNLAFFDSTVGDLMSELRVECQ